MRYEIEGHQDPLISVEDVQCDYADGASRHVLFVHLRMQYAVSISKMGRNSKLSAVFVPR